MVKVALQMDAIEHIHIAADTSFALALEAQARGYELFYYLADELSLYAPQEVRAPLRALSVRDEAQNYFTRGEAVDPDLREMDVVLMRQDPPFNMAYITATYILEKLADDCLVVNDPAGVRNAPEKILPSLCEGILPPSLMTRERAALHKFRTIHKEIVLKPLYLAGGAGIFRIRPDDDNFNALIDMMLAQNGEPILAQAFIPDVQKGDRRVLLVEGEAVAVVNRIPPTGDMRANLHSGGRAEAADVSETDLAISEKIAPFLRDNGIVLAGIDVIGTYLTEINVTSPTGIREVKQFGGVDIAALVWDAIESRLK